MIAGPLLFDTAGAIVTRGFRGSGGTAGGGVAEHFGTPVLVAVLDTGSDNDSGVDGQKAGGKRGRANDATMVKVGWFGNGYVAARAGFKSIYVYCTLQVRVVKSGMDICDWFLCQQITQLHVCAYQKMTLLFTEIAYCIEYRVVYC